MTAPRNNPGADAARPVAGPGAGFNSANEPRIALPTRTLMLSMFSAGLLVVGGWSAAVVTGPWGDTAFITGLVGIGVTTLISLCGVLIITPWKPRPIAEWMTMWLAGTVFRMLMTPAILFLLYSATSRALAVKPLVLSVALTYLVSVLAEAGIIASHVRRSLPPLR
jgi:hypothetical protein